MGAGLAFLRNLPERRRAPRKAAPVWLGGKETREIGPPGSQTGRIAACVAGLKKTHVADSGGADARPVLNFFYSTGTSLSEGVKHTAAPHG